MKQALSDAVLSGLLIPVEPDVWIEYLRRPVDRPVMFWENGIIDALARSLTPDGAKVRNRLDGNDQVWEYLM